MRLKGSKDKIPRKRGPKKQKIKSPKKSYTVCLTEYENNELIKQHGTITAAILTTIKNK
jgi:hypothetical protein